MDMNLFIVDASEPSRIKAYNALIPRFIKIINNYDYIYVDSGEFRQYIIYKNK